jgi:hypothetical protein
MYLNNLYFSTLTAERPTAHITRGKNRLKSYCSAYYFKDGSNFEIELYNPKQTRVLAKIKLNGVPVSAGGIVVNPGQRVFLERFIESDRKFEFSTYQVGKTETDQQAIQNNGLVEIDFFDEFVPGPSLTTSTGNPLFNINTPIGNYYYSNQFNTSSLLLDNSTHTVNTSNSNRKIETGRVEMGKKSEQVLETAHGNFHSWVVSSYSFKLMPDSEKSVEAGEIRNYCPGCGNRVKKSSWKFCPSCGESLKD